MRFCTVTEPATQGEADTVLHATQLNRVLHVCTDPTHAVVLSREWPGLSPERLVALRPLCAV